MASETCSERSIEGLWLHTWFHTFSGPTCPTQARDAQVLMWRKCPFNRRIGPLCPVLTRDAINYRGKASHRPGMTALSLRLRVAGAEGAGEVLEIGGGDIGHRPIGDVAVGPAHDVVAVDGARRRGAELGRQRGEADDVQAVAVHQRRHG